MMYTTLYEVLGVRTLIYDMVNIFIMLKKIIFEFFFFLNIFWFYLTWQF